MNALRTVKCLVKMDAKNVTVFWNMTQYSLTSFIDVSQQQAAFIFLYPEDGERECFSLISVNFNQTTRCNIPEDIRISTLSQE
jgi:hypothetical protein